MPQPHRTVPRNVERVSESPATSMSDMLWSTHEKDAQEGSVGQAQVGNPGQAQERNPGQVQGIVRSSSVRQQPPGRSKSVRFAVEEPQMEMRRAKSLPRVPTPLPADFGKYVNDFVQEMRQEKKEKEKMEERQKQDEHGQ